VFHEAAANRPNVAVIWKTCEQAPLVVGRMLRDVGRRWRPVQPPTPNCASGFAHPIE